MTDKSEKGNLDWKLMDKQICGFYYRTEHCNDFKSFKYIRDSVMKI